MDIHSIHKAMCAELIALKKAHKQWHKSLTDAEKADVLRYRHTTDQRVLEQRKEKEESRRREKKAIQDGLREWADVTFHYWDTRNAPSNIIEYEASMEMPYSQQKWLHT